MRRLKFDIAFALFICSILIIPPYARATAEPADTAIINAEESAAPDMEIPSGDNAPGGNMVDNGWPIPGPAPEDALRGEIPGTVSGETYERRSDIVEDEGPDLLPETIDPEFPLGKGADRRLRADGKFKDWVGMPNLGDPQGDSPSNDDIKGLYWGTNQEEARLYYMIERFKPAWESAPVKYTLHFDINDNGRYADSVDRRAVISYYPINKNKGYVQVWIFNSRGYIAGVYGGQWGEGVKNSTIRCELFIPLELLGINAHQPIRFYLTSGYPDGSDRLPDSGDVQWAPVPVSGKLGLAAILGGGIFIIIKAARSRKQC